MYERASRREGELSDLVCDARRRARTRYVVGILVVNRRFASDSNGDHLPLTRNSLEVLCAWYTCCRAACRGIRKCDAG